MSWIDYRKAYDSVPHSWILKTLQMYRFSEKLIKFMETSMSNWKTTIKLWYNDGCITTDQIKIKRGIFQGDSFSPLLLCLALVPLTSELATSGYGYKISNTSAPISNLFYMDDLKLYSKNHQEQVGELKIMKQFSDDIGMEFGLEKCAKASFKKGKLASTGNIIIDEVIEELNQEGIYKYLDVDESDGIQHSKMKEKVRKEDLRRVRLILITELNGRNKPEAVNSLAVPVVQYSFGIIVWNISELKKIDTKTRKLLNMHKMLHPKADVERLYIPRKDGGRGLIEVETAFKIATIGFDHYLKNKDGQYPKQVLEHDTSKAKHSITKNAIKFKGELPISEFENKGDKTASENAKALKNMIKSKMKSVKKVESEKWKNKALRGQYPKLLAKPHVDIVNTNQWLSSNLKGETGGLLVAAQDQALNTRNYQKVICGQKVESKCRMCSQHEETVDHIVSGCEVLAKTEYISRHDKAAAYLHRKICQDHDIEVIDKWYEQKPESVTHNKDSKFTIMWDMPVNTDRTRTANRPDIIIKDSVNSTCELLDMSIPSDRNIARKEIEKKGKYKDLELEIQRTCQMKTEVIPVFVGALGTIKKGMVENIKRVSGRANVTETQKISMLGSARILRKVLNV